MPDRLPWLPARLLGLLVLGWAGMGVLASLVSLLARDLSADPALVGAVQLFGMMPALALAPQVTGLRPLPPHRPPGPLAIGAALSAGIALQLVLVGLTAALGELVPALAPSAEATARLSEATALRDWGRAFTVPFMLVFVAPMTEELLFRGAIQPALAARLGSAPAVLATALLFALFHLSPYALVYATLAGIVLGVLRERTGSLRPSFALHAGFNAAPMLLDERLVAIPGFHPNAPGTSLPLPVLGGAIAIAGGSLAVFAASTRAPAGR